MDKHEMMAKSSSSNEDESSSIALYAMQLATSSVVPMVLKGTVELGVLEILEREGPDADAMLSPPGAHDPLDKMLSLLTSHSILSVSPRKDHQGDGGCRVYGLAPVAKYFSRNRENGSLSGQMLMVQDKVIIDM